MNSQYRQIDSNPHKKFKTSPQITSIIGGSQMSMCISEKRPNQLSKVHFMISLNSAIWDFISYLSYQLHCCIWPDKRCHVVYLTACCLYQVMMTLHFLNDVANDAESLYNSKMTS